MHGVMGISRSGQQGRLTLKNRGDFMTGGCAAYIKRVGTGTMQSEEPRAKFINLDSHT